MSINDGEKMGGNADLKSISGDWKLAWKKAEWTCVPALIPRLEIFDISLPRATQKCFRCI